MAHSPIIRGTPDPLDPQEEPILENLLNLRDKLLNLRENSSLSYIRSQDVIPLYDQVVEQVNLLNEIRTEKRQEQNRVDRVLDDCFQMISLQFLSTGQNSEAPAVYAATSTIKRLLDHLVEAAFYGPQDLESGLHTLDRIDDVVRKGRDTYSPHVLTLLEARVQTCRKILSQLQRAIADISPQLLPIYEKLISILRSVSAANTRHHFPTGEVKSFQRQLKEIELFLKEGKVFGTVVEARIETSVKDGRMEGSFRQGKVDGLVKEGPMEFILRDLKIELRVVDGGVEGVIREGKIEGIFRDEVEDDNRELPENSGQDLVESLLQRCLLWVEIVLERRGKIDDRFKSTYEKLRKIRNELDHKTLLKNWALRETDLYSYQRELDRVDESRVDGNFFDADGNPADLFTQRTLLYLIRRSYAYIYQLIISSEPVSEALLPVYNQLQTLRKCFNEVKKSGGVSSRRELYPYTMKLHSIDNMRVDGKFTVGRDVPEGQATLSDLLNECYEQMRELTLAAEGWNGNAESGE
ncbi:MAG: hypothetical protein M1815_005471 [Lichina confinis]|nr:MAG: hypothetical protein M1815_005471 [Lichina confinis]